MIIPRGAQDSIFKVTFWLSNKSNTSQGYTAINFYQTELPKQIKVKRLVSRAKTSVALSVSGRRLIKSRGHCSVRTTLPHVNYKFRDSRISFIAGLIFNPKSYKLFSLLLLSSGTVTYLPTTSDHEVFRLITFDSAVKKPSRNQNNVFNTFLPFEQFFFLIYQLPKNKPVCLLESRPGAGIQYARSPGTKAKIVRMDSRVGTGIIFLPSGLRKVFSIYGLGSKGSVALAQNRKILNNKASSMYIKGRKAVVRGVAMNPVDHPHGGRTKAIAHPRTPWGTTSKRK